MFGCPDCRVRLHHGPYGARWLAFAVVGAWRGRERRWPLAGKGRAPYPQAKVTRRAVHRSVARMRPRCDPIDIPAIRAAIAKGETTERRAYQVYASTAARPYARSSFDVMLRARTLRQTQGQPAERAFSIQPALGRATPVKPSKVLTLTGDSASLSVKRGALIATRDGMSLVYEPRAVKPSAIVLTGWGGVITLAALRFCATHNIAVVILDWDRDFMTAMALPGRRAANIARAQLAALDPVRAFAIAKALIAAKIEAHAHVGAIVKAKASAAIERVQTADTERRLLMVEAQAARLAWAERPIVMRWREAGHIPSSWKLPFCKPSA
jgi:hypothetical protein